jgi:hypothetical protein
MPASERQVQSPGGYRRFTTCSGRYMYHCHILEHEDLDMMRPFVTMPAELMPFMA